MDGAFAVCVLVTLGFGAFIVWGRSASGRQALRQTLGEPTPRPQTRPLAKAKNVTTTRRSATKPPSSSRAAVKKPAEPSASTTASAAKTPRASAPASQKPALQKPVAKQRNDSTPRSRK